MALSSDEVREANENRKTIFMGLGFAIVWLLVVGGISYFWALSDSGPAEGGSPAAQEAH